MDFKNRSQSQPEGAARTAGKTQFHSSVETVVFILNTLNIKRKISFLGIQIKTKAVKGKL